jgi:hypothetical protein
MLTVGRLRAVVESRGGSWELGLTTLACLGRLGAKVKDEVLACGCVGGCRE